MAKGATKKTPFDRLRVKSWGRHLQPLQSWFEAVLMEVLGNSPYPMCPYSVPLILAHQMR
jgi:hypothetical protein